MKALVTGATGFIGGHLAQTLHERGHEVRVLVRQPPRTSDFAAYEVVSGDLTDSQAAAQAVKGMDVVFHLAAIRDRWGIPYADYHRTNVDGTRYLLDAAVAAGSRFVYCSSVGVMGHPNQLNIDESFPYSASDGKYNYSHTKALADEMVLQYGASERLFATVVRAVITYGPGDTWGMVTRLIDMLAQRSFLFVGDGRNHMHLAYISDLVEGFLLAASNDQANGRPYIVAGPAPITLNDLVSKVCGLLSVAPPQWHIPTPIAHTAGRGMEWLFTLKRQMGISALGDVPFITRDKVDTLTINRSFSTQRAEAELGYQPQIGYDEGLQRTVDWWRTWSQEQG